MNHPPIANKTVCIDFDGTIVPWGPLMAPKAPFPGVAEAIRDLHNRGSRIVIFTSRLSQVWLDDEGHDPLVQQAYVVDTLLAYEIPYDLVTADKVPAEAYFDDKAITVSTDIPLDLCINRWLYQQEVA